MSYIEGTKEQEQRWSSYNDVVFADHTQSIKDDDERLRKYSAELRSVVVGALSPSDQDLPAYINAQFNRFIETQINREIDVSAERLSRNIITARSLFEQVVAGPLPAHATATATADSTSARVTTSGNTSAGNTSASNTSAAAVNASAGNTSVGNTSAADAFASNAPASNTSAGNTSTCNTSTCNASAVNTSAGNTSAANTSAAITSATIKSAGVTSGNTPATSISAKKPNTSMTTTESFKVMGDRASSSDVPADKSVVEYPRRSGNWYCLNCPVCRSHFEAVNALYKHFLVSHHGILSGDKSYPDALEIGGTIIQGAHEDWAKFHNEEYNIKKNVIYEKARKFLLAKKSSGEQGQSK